MKIHAKVTRALFVSLVAAGSLAAWPAGLYADDAAPAITEAGDAQAEVSVDSDANASDIVEIAPDYNAATDSSANSWRFEQGVLIDQAEPVTSRSVANTWSYKDGVWYCTNGTSVSGAKGMGVDVSQW